MTADRIEREIFIAAPVERVWAVLTEAEHVGVWFGQGEPAKIDLRPGGAMLLDHGEYGTFPTTIEEVEPPRYFSYRWAHPFPGEQAHEGNSNLVEFTLTAERDGTRLSVAESGFSTLPVPQEERDASVERNGKGWIDAIDGLRKHAERLPA